MSGSDEKINERSMKVMVDGEEMLLKGDFYDVTDWMGEEKHLIGLYLETMNGEIYCDLSVSFGEFVGQYGNFFANVNLFDFDTEKFLQENNIAFPGGGFKQSGFVQYPAYRLSPYVMDILFTTEEIGEYKKDYDFYGELAEVIAEDPDWVKHSLDREKASFDEFLAERMGRA